MEREISKKFGGSAKYREMIKEADEQMRAKPDLSQYKTAGCFVAGTLVHTKEGLKPIEQIKVGDWVLSKPESGEGEQAYKRVTKTVSFDDKEVWTIAFSEKDVTDPNVDSLYYSRDCTRIVATSNHPFWVINKGWTALRDVRRYDRLLLENGKEVVVYEHMNLHTYESSKTLAYADTACGMYEGYLIDLSLNTQVEFCFPEERVPQPREADFYNPDTYFYTTVYNFEVEDFHTYYVGTKGVWVHNTNCPEDVVAQNKGHKMDTSIEETNLTRTIPKEYKCASFRSAHPILSYCDVHIT